jgi:hypothetical protein
VLRAPDLRDKLAAEAVEPHADDARAVRRFIREDIARWTALARARKIQLKAEFFFPFTFRSMARNTQVAADHERPAHHRTLAPSSPRIPSRGWSDAVEHEAHRTFMNWLGCAVGAARHESVDAALAAVQMLQPAPQASVLGRAERVDMASAALLNGITSHTFDFDDTHLKTIIHPAGPVASALLALAEHRRCRAAR